MTNWWYKKYIFCLYIQNITTVRQTRHPKSQTGIKKELLYWFMQLVLSQEITPHRCPPRPEFRPAQLPLCDQFIEFQQKIKDAYSYK